MIEVLDNGHQYRLLSLDGQLDQTLTFVKRCNPPEKFPGNTNAYAGTTIQSVIRCLLDRMRYLQNQIWAPENALIIWLLRACLWLLETRAARRHGRRYCHNFEYAEFAPLCSVCGHTECEHQSPALVKILGDFYLRRAKWE